MTGSGNGLGMRLALPLDTVRPIISVHVEVQNNKARKIAQEFE